MKCPKCGHPAEDHNDAGSVPIEGVPSGFRMPAFINAGQMHCYANPAEGDEGVENWLGRICSCTYSPEGSSRWYR